MEPDDVDSALDMRLILTYDGTMPISTFSRSKNLVLQAGLMFGKNGMEISCFIPDDLEANREVSIFLAQNNVKKQNKMFILNFTFDNMEAFSALQSTVTVLKSIVLDNLKLHNGVYYISLRFSSSELENVSATVMKYTTMIDNVGVEYLGSNPGIWEISREVGELTPLIHFIFSVKPPNHYFEGEAVKALGEEWVCEARFMSSSTEFRQLVRTRDKIADPEKYGISTVDEENNLYEMEVESELLSFYFQRSYDFRMMRMRRSMHFHSGTVDISVIVPELLSSDYLKILTDTANQYPDWHLAIKKVSRLI